MEYAFSWSSFFFGALIVAVCTALVVWYQPIADAMGSGAASYDRLRFWGLIGIAVGFVIALNLHMLLLGWLLGMLFVR